VAGDADLNPANIKSGVNIFGVPGSVVQASGTATTAQVLSGQTFSNASGAATGAMANQGAVNFTPGTANQTIPAGYHDGSGTVAGDADLAAANIKSGANIFGVVGNVVQASGTATTAQVLKNVTFSTTSGAAIGDMLTQTLSATSATVNAGYYAATTLSAVDADLKPENIKSGHGRRPGTCRALRARARGADRRRRGDPPRLRHLDRT
jgi:hypothetical protein